MEQAPGVPTLEEMMHANALYQMDREAYLEHYGIKGMQWGVRRSREVLGRLSGRSKPKTELKDEEGHVVGGVRAATRAGAQKLKDMRQGTTLILEDANGAKKIMAKQSDGTFKEVYLSADAERVLRTTKKDQSELSDKEINDAINRSKKIEEYNKLFNPQPNPNADLEARVAAMQLQVKLREAQLQLNPPKQKLVSRFVDNVSGGYGVYQQMNKALNGELNKTLVDIYKELKGAHSEPSTVGATVNDSPRDPYARKTRASTRAAKAYNPDFKPSAEQQKRIDDLVYNITSMGQDDPFNPFVTPLPELERSSR
jgi:hypothetical protein